MTRTAARHPGEGPRGGGRRLVCGKARPKQLSWGRGTGCTGAPAGWVCWHLEYEGFKTFEFVKVSFTGNGGVCNFQGGECQRDIPATSTDGRGTLFRYAVPAGYSGRFIAQAGKLRAVLPN